MKKIYTFIDNIQLGLKLYYRKMNNIVSPTICYLFVTQKCNLNCIYCCVEHDRPIKELSTQQIFNIIDELHIAGIKKIVLSGGEPLIRNDIYEIIDYIKSKKIICDLVTNGTLIKDKIDKLKKLNTLAISLDGNRIDNDKNRGIGTFDRAIEGLKAAIKNNILVRLNCVIVKNNLNSFREVFNIAKKLNIYVGVNIPCEDDVSKYRLTNEEVRNVYRQIKQLRNEGYPILYSNSLYDYMIKYPVDYSEIIFKKDKHLLDKKYRKECLYKKVYCFIDADGRVFPCMSLWRRHYKVKNIFEHGFKACYEFFNTFDCYRCAEQGCQEIENIFSLKGVLDKLLTYIKQIIK